MKRGFLIFCIILGLGACQDQDGAAQNQEDLGPIRTYKSYIGMFVKCQEMVVQSVGGVKIDEATKVFGPCADRWTIGETSPYTFSVTDGIELDIMGHWTNVDERDTCIFYDNSYYSSPHLNEDERSYYLERKKGYDHYINLIGDTSYNLRSRDGHLEIAIITPLKFLTIAADKNFSSDYPAGSDLSTLFTVYFDDMYSTVKNGYKSVEGTYKTLENSSLQESIFKYKLSEANFEERPFIGYRWFCFLNVAPEETGTYTFKVKAEFVDGTVLEAQSPPINIKGANE
jgi:hypothetical protein